MSQRITKTIFLTAAEAATYKSTGTCQHLLADGETYITVSDTDTDSIVYCPEDEPITRAELAEAVKHHYSTTEQVVGTWIDGKPIYETTVYFEEAISLGSTENQITTPFENSVDKLISVEGIRDSLPLSCPFAGHYSSGNKIYVYRLFSYFDKCNAFIFRYTKTTDTAPSA